MRLQGEALGRALLDAFVLGDPELAYGAALALISEHRLALTEVAKLRFKLNFGSPFCLQCEGLKAGPEVIATCYQMQQCHFRNLKKGEEDPRHLLAVEALLAQTTR